MWKKLIAPTVLVVLFWLAFTGVVVVSMYWLAQFHSQVAAETGFTIQAANSMSDTSWRIMATALIAKASDVDKKEAEIANLDRAFEKQLRIAEETSYTKTEQGISRTIRQRYAEFFVLIKNRLAALRGKTTVSVPSESQSFEIAQNISDLCTELRVFNENLAVKDVYDQGRLTTFIALALIGILLAGTVGGVLWSIQTASDVGHSISQISISLEGADSSLKEKIGFIDLEASGDLALLQKQVDIVADRVRQVVEDLHRERFMSLTASRLAAAGELAAGVAHEIRNPLTSVKLLLHAAAENTPERALSLRQFDAIQAEITRMEKTVQGLLDFARPAEVHRVRHDLRCSIASAIQLVEGLAAKQAVVIRQDFPLQAAEVNADRGQLHQVFVNLLINAIEAMTSGGELCVGIRSNPTSSMHQITFTDSGPGIPPHIMERLFEPFVTSKQRGTGLGLAISRRLVKEQGGTLTAANAEPKGAVMTLELPPASLQETLDV